MYANRYDDSANGVTCGGQRSRRGFLRASAVAGAASIAGCLGAGRESGGLELTIGYQPFYAEAWSAVVIKNGGLADEYLPDGYTVGNWDSALQGSIVITRMISDKNQIGYTGDMPTITGLANDRTPISAVGVGGYSRGQQCNIAAVPKGSPIETAQEIDGKDVGLTTGSCTHRFYLTMAKEAGIEATIQDSGIGNILAEIRQGSLPVGFGWEPAMTRSIVQEDAADYLLTGAQYNVDDASGVVMLDSLIENHREAAIGWMKAELEAKRIMREEHERTLDLIAQEGDLSTYDRETLRACIYRNLPMNPDIDRLQFLTNYDAFDPANRLLRREAPQFLKDQGVIEAIPDDDRYKPGITERAASELGVGSGSGGSGSNASTSTDLGGQL